MSTRNFSRRQFLRLTVIASALPLAAACAPAPPAVPATPVAPLKPTEAAKPVEVAKPDGAAKPTTEAKPVAPTAEAKPAAAPVPAKPAVKPGLAMVGKLEGSDIVTDPALFPKTFREAPMLAELVKAGKLPPVQERIGQDPLVVKPLAEIGKYGGTWRRGFTGPGDRFNGYRTVSGPDNVLAFDYTGDKVRVNTARSFEFQDGGRVLVVQLRRGMRWSDGQPFTADDFVFWFEDVYQNKDLVPTPSAAMSINGKPGKIEKADALTVRFVFPEPYYILPDVLAGQTNLGGHIVPAFQGGYGGFAPSHYMKQFLPKYVPQDKLDQMANDAKFDNWVNLYKFKNDWCLNPELPTLSPWKMVSPINTPAWTLERNPYSIWVDTEGNQLPYIDKVQMTLAENLEVLNLRAIAGEYDSQERHIDMGKLPVLLENQQKGGYSIKLDPANWGGDMLLRFNMSYDADPEIAKWFNITDFRRALSLAIDRDQMNETFWLGTGTPGSVAPADNNPWFPGPEYRTLWSTFDPKQANELLDKIGLDKKDAEGYRLRTDGKGRLRLEIVTLGAAFMPYTQMSEVVRQHWKQVGIDAVVQEMERSLATTKAAANEIQFWVWSADTSDHIFTGPHNVLPFEGGSPGGPLFAQWYQSNGAQGKEPPPRMKEAYEKLRKGAGVPDTERVQLGKDIWKILVDEVYNIGVCGLSPAVNGVRVVKNTLGNVPSRSSNNPDAKSSTNMLPVTLFFRS